MIRYIALAAALCLGLCAPALGQVPNAAGAPMVPNAAPASLSGTYCALAGCTMSGNIAMGGNAISGASTIGLSGQLSSTLATGTAPFVVASTTNVANLNASSLSGATFANPGAIGSGTPATSVAASGLLGTSSAGTAANPSVYVGNATTGLYSVSTTGLGLSVNGAVKIDWGITNSGATTLVGSTFANTMQLSSGATLQLRAGNTLLSSPATATLQLGQADAASPVAQTLQVQSVTPGAVNTAAVNWTQQASLSTGTGTAGLLNIMTGFASLSENATITATNASPGVITYTAHGLVPGASGQFSNSGGALPTGISAATTYYVCKDANYAANTFDISLTWTNGACGSLVNTSSTGSGTNTFTTNTTVQNAASTVVTIGPYGLTGSQTTSPLSITQVLNTSGNHLGVQFNFIDIASGASGLLFQINGGVAGTTNAFKVDVAGNTTSNGIANNAETISAFSSNSTTVVGSFRNGNVGASAQTQVGIGNNTSNSEVTMTLNSSANSGGNGANSFTINSAGAMFIQGNGTNAIGISAAQLVTLPAITTDATHTDTTVCQDTTTHGLYFGSGTAGICLGNVSSIRFKPDYALIADGLGVMNALDPGLYHYGQGMVAGDDGKLKVGFTAERYAAVLPQFTRYDGEGRPNGLDMMALVPYAARAIQQLDAKKADRDEVETLRQLVSRQQTEITSLKQRMH